MQAASVSDLVISIKNLLEDQFQEVFVEGEVTNLSLSSSGHWYFNLSDASSSISCALFKLEALRNPLIRNLKDGDKIIILGPVSVYQKRGSFQVIVKRLFPAGVGQLKIQLERLKSKLSQEGLFDLDKKKSIPKFPKRIAIITAEHGAALQDFLNVYKRRSLWQDILIIPSLVQGDGAAKKLLMALKTAQKIEGIDVIVLTRGGGSLEDLWAFNDEDLVREISNCPVPVISAVGHEVDYTLCDFVADHRSETPSAAAEFLSQPHTELKSRLYFCHTHLKSEMIKIQQRFQIIREKSHPSEMIHLIKKNFIQAQLKLSQVRLMDRGFELMGLNEKRRELDELEMRIKHTSEVKINSWKDKLIRYEQVLTAIDPKRVLNRGYSYIQDDNKLVITNFSDFQKLKDKTQINIHFKDGIGNAQKI
jgi:exodeoxyribonuclease VII large subunit